MYNTIPLDLFDLQNVEEKEEGWPIPMSEDVRRVAGGGEGEGGVEEAGGGGGGGDGGRRGGREGMRRALSRGERVKEEGESVDQVDAEPTADDKTSGMTSALCVLF